MQIYSINQQGYNQTFGNVQSTAEVLKSRIKDPGARVRFVVSELNNTFADIIISESSTKVVARDGFELPYGLGKSFSIYSAGGREWMHQKASGIDDKFNSHEVDLGIMDSDKMTGDVEIDAARIIADQAFFKATDNSKNPYYILGDEADAALGVLLNSKG